LSKRLYGYIWKYYCYLSISIQSTCYKFAQKLHIALIASGSINVGNRLIQLYVSSSKYGIKDIIKIEDKIDVDLTMLGLIDPAITVNIIENDKIVNKMNINIPDEVQGLFQCKNPRCVSNSDVYVTPKFKLAHVNGKIHYRCNYCEELTTYSL